MAYYCWKCGNEQIFEVKVGVKVGRKDECPHCGADLHVCKNCNLYEPALHNQCREPEAAFIRDRAYSGPYSPKKNVQEKNAAGATSTVGWLPAQLNSVHLHIYRYADLLLLLAEAEVEDGKLAELWLTWDNMTILAQLGQLPAPPSTGG